jgi:hypothetical protein
MAGTALNKLRSVPDEKMLAILKEELQGPKASIYAAAAVSLKRGVGRVSETLGGILTAIRKIRPDLSPSRFLLTRNGKWVEVPGRYGTVGNLVKSRSTVPGRYPSFKNATLGQRGNIKGRYQDLSTFSGRFGIRSRGDPPPPKVREEAANKADDFISRLARIAELVKTKSTKIKVYFDKIIGPLAKAIHESVERGDRVGVARAANEIAQVEEELGRTEKNTSQQQGRMASETLPLQKKGPDPSMSFNNLIKRRTNQNVNKNAFNSAIKAKLEANYAQVRQYNSGTSSLRSLLDKLRLVNGTGVNSDRIFTSVMELIERRVDDIVDNSRNRNLRYQKTKLNDLRQSLGLNTLGFRNTSRFRRINEIFDRGARSLNIRISQKMNELRRAPSNRMNNIGRAPDPFAPPPPRNILRPNAPVFTPPPNMPKPPSLNLGERRALNNAGGEMRALNLVQNAGGTNEVLKATNQLREAGGSPALAEAMGANKKNIKIVLQLAGAPVNANKVNTNQLNNVAKVALATPKLRKRRRSKRKPGSKKSGKPKVTALRKLLRSLPKKKLLAVLPKSNKNSLAGKNKANVATRVTSYLSGRTKTKK